MPTITITLDTGELDEAQKSALATLVGMYEKAPRKPGRLSKEEAEARAAEISELPEAEQEETLAKEPKSVRDAFARGATPPAPPPPPVVTEPQQLEAFPPPPPPPPPAPAPGAIDVVEFMKRVSASTKVRNLPTFLEEQGTSIQQVVTDDETGAALRRKLVELL